MNRMEELKALQAQLEDPPTALEDTLARAQTRLAKQRRARGRWLRRGLSTMAASFALFVVLVNFCMPVAYACSNVPVLRELAEAVTFSRSLTDAVKNEYVQPIDLMQTQNGITAKVEYLIVDQKQVNVFFRLEGEGYTQLNAEADFFKADGSDFDGGYSFGTNGHNVPAGELQSASLDLFQADVPEKMLMRLAVFEKALPMDNESKAPDAVAKDQGLLSSHPGPLWDYLAQFDFLLEFDPTDTQQGVIYPVNQTVQIDDQQLIIRQLEVYPTHLRIVTTDHPDNTASIRNIRFLLEGDWGMTFTRESNGMISVGQGDLMTYYSESPWFYLSDRLTLTITEAQLLDHDRQKICVDLTTGETDKPLPEGMEFLSATHEENGWIVTFRGKRLTEGHNYQMFSWNYYDSKGDAHTISGMTSGMGMLTQEEQEHWQTNSMGLIGHHEDTVWLQPLFTRRWTAESPIVVSVK